MSRLRARLERIERSRPPVERPDLAAEAAVYGERVASDPWARTYQGYENGVPVTSIVSGKVVYQIVGVRAEYLT